MTSTLARFKARSLARPEVKEAYDDLAEWPHDFSPAFYRRGHSDLALSRRRRLRLSIEVARATKGQTSRRDVKEPLETQPGVETPG